MYVLSVQYSCAVVSVFCCGGKNNCEHRQSHVDFLKNDYSVSLFSRNNSLAKTYFSRNPNFLLLHISFFVSINQHHYNHDRFSKISRTFFVMYFNGFLRYDRKKKSSSRLSGEKKKIQSSMYFNGFLRYDRKKKVPVVCLAKKKRYSRLSDGCAVLAEKKRYSRLFNLY